MKKTNAPAAVRALRKTNGDEIREPGGGFTPLFGLLPPARRPVPGDLPSPLRAITSLDPVT